MFDRKCEVVPVPGGAIPVVVTRLVQRYPLPCQRGEIFERLDHTRAAVCPVHDQTAGPRVAAWGDAQAAVATECDKRQSLLWPRSGQLVRAEWTFDPNNDGVVLNRLVKVEQLCRS